VLTGWREKRRECQGKRSLNLLVIGCGDARRAGGLVQRQANELLGLVSVYKL